MVRKTVVSTAHLVSMPVLNGFSEDGSAKRALVFGRKVFIHEGASLSMAAVVKGEDRTGAQ
jgi:hypothetical protein